MTTREEFKKFLDYIGHKDIDQEGFQRMVNNKFEKLIKGNKIGIAMNDWKSTAEQFKDVAEMLKMVDGGYIHHFECGYDFPSGLSGYDIITVVSDKEITFEHAEAIADLFYNYGAESDNLI